MNGKQILLQAKYARIIQCISQRYCVSQELAMDRLYHSNTFQLINDGVADLHCRSDLYLADEIALEYERNGMPFSEIRYEALRKADYRG